MSSMKKIVCVAIVSMLLLSMMLLGGIEQLKAEGTVVSVDPAYVEIAAGDPYTINITVSDINDLYGWEIWLYYPTGILDPYPLITECVTEGPFLKEYAQAHGGSTFFIFDDDSSTYDYNITHGLIHVGCVILPPPLPPPLPGASGTGVLVTINFTAVAVGGPYVVALEDTEFVDSNVNFIYPEVLSGEIIVFAVRSDINLDGIVNTQDIAICALAFGSKPEDPHWNPLADMNEDGMIRIRDIVLIALHYGEHV